MAKYQRVQPGDLIQADYLNTLVLAIETLESRVTALEATGPRDACVIDQILPLGVLENGAPIEIHGQNFTIPAPANEVKIGGVSIGTFDLVRSSDQTLFLNLPELSGLAAAGTLVSVTIRNAKGSVGNGSLVMKPRSAVPAGIVLTNYASLEPKPDPTTPPKFTVGTKYTFHFGIIAQVSAQGSYSATASVSDPSWDLNIPVSGATKTPGMAQIPFTLPKSDPNNPAATQREVVVEVTPKVGAGAATFSFVVAELTPGSTVTVPNNGNTKYNFGLNANVPLPDVVNIRVKNAATPGAAIQFAKGAINTLALALFFYKPGHYEVSFAMDTPSAWSPAPAPIKLDFSGVPPDGSGSRSDQNPAWTAPATAQTATLTITIVKDNDPANQTFTFKQTINVV